MGKNKNKDVTFDELCDMNRDELLEVINDYDLDIDPDDCDDDELLSEVVAELNIDDDNNSRNNNSSSDRSQGLIVLLGIIAMVGYVYRNEIKVLFTRKTA